MKYRFFILLLLAILVLSGCACDHIWTEADCLHPAVCANCEAPGAQALGHNWLDATCTQVKTCTRCGSTDADPLGHSFGQWVFLDDQMSRTCSVCALEEKTDLDRGLYLEILLTGHWNLFGITQEGVIQYISQENFTDLYLHFGADQTATFRLPDGPNQAAAWRFDSYEATDECETYRFTLTCGENAYPMELRHQSRKNVPAYLLVIPGSQQEFHMVQTEDGEQSLLSIWGIMNSTAAQPMGNPQNWLRFREDRTVEGFLGSDVEGIWHIYPRVQYQVDRANPLAYGIVIENRAGTQTQIFHGTLSTDGELRLDVKINGRYQTFGPIDEAHLADIFAAVERLLGVWSSTEVHTFGEFTGYCGDYTITFHEDNTVTANLGKELTGYWMLFPNYWEDYQGRPKRKYTYVVQFEGSREEVQCSIDDDGRLNVSNCSQLKDKDVTFLPLTQEGTLLLQGVFSPIGNWKSYYYRVKNAADQTTVQEDVFTDAYSITFHADGTFTAQLGDSVSGIWRYEYFVDIYGEPGTETEEYRWAYRITLQDSTESQGEYVNAGEASLLFITLPHPEIEGLEIIYAMQKEVP